MRKVDSELGSTGSFPVKSEASKSSHFATVEWDRTRSQEQGRRGVLANTGDVKRVSNMVPRDSRGIISGSQMEDVCP